MDLTILYEFLKKLKIRKSEMAAASDVIMLLWLPWNQLSSKWFRLIQSIKNAHYMCQISSQLDEWCQK